MFTTSFLQCGIDHKLKEAWHGPYPVMERISAVDYRVDIGRGRKKVLHINNLKKHFERENEVLRLTVMAEDFSEDKEKGVRLKGECEGYMEEDIVKVKEKFRHVLSDKPGKTDVCKLVIDTGDARPIALPPYRVPEKMKEGVKEEVRKMVESGTIIPTNSPWSAPIVPVPKPDGSIRICIDFRRLNSVTKSDPYYMITLDEILERVGRSTVISSLTLQKDTTKLR